jgi:hypothetical protein
LKQLTKAFHHFFQWLRTPSAFAFVVVIAFQVFDYVLSAIGPEDYFEHSPTGCGKGFKSKTLTRKPSLCGNGNFGRKTFNAIWMQANPRVFRTAVPNALSLEQSQLLRAKGFLSHALEFGRTNLAQIPLRRAKDHANTNSHADQQAPVPGRRRKRRQRVLD